MKNLRALAIILLVTAALCGEAQTIQHERCLYLPVLSSTREHNTPNKWPDLLHAGFGTVVDINLGVNRADLFLFARPSLSAAVAERVGQSLARITGSPTIYASQASDISCLRLPLNHLLTKQQAGFLATKIQLSLDMRALFSALLADHGLRQPLAIGVDAAPADVLVLQSDHKRTEIPRWTGWVNPGEGHSILQFQTTIGPLEWLGMAVGFIYQAALCFLPVYLAIAIFRYLRREAQRRARHPDLSDEEFALLPPDTKRHNSLRILSLALFMNVCLLFSFFHSPYAGKVAGLFDSPGLPPGTLADLMLCFGLATSSVTSLAVFIYNVARYRPQLLSPMVRRKFRMWTWLFAGMLVFGAAAVIWLGHPLWPDLELFMLQRATVQNLLFVSLMLFLTAFMVMFGHVWHSNKRTRIQAS